MKSIRSAKQAKEKPAPLPPALAELMKASGACLAVENPFAEGVVSTGLLSLDHLLGGGWAKHRINEINGESGGGKTTLALRTVASVQEEDPAALVVWMDTENSFSPKLARECGVDMSRLIYIGVTVEEKGVVRPRTGEEFCSFADEAVATSAVKLLVIDSIGALMPGRKLEKDFGEGEAPALRARLVGSLAEKFVNRLAGYNCTVLAINHLTGQLSSDQYGNQRTISKGGKTWNYLKSASVSLKAARTEAAGDGFSASVEVEVVKCRRAPRSTKTTLINVMGKGFSVIDSMVEAAIELGIAESRGGWITVGEQKFNGRAKFALALKEDKDLVKTIKDTIEAMCADL